MCRCGSLFGGRHLEQLLISIPPSHSAYKADFQIGNPCKVFRRQVIRGLSGSVRVCVCARARVRVCMRVHVYVGACLAEGNYVHFLSW